MKNNYIFLLLVLGFALRLSAQSEFKPNEQLSALTEKENVGMVAGYAIDGETIWTGASGYACEDSKTPFTTTTVTRVASIAKPFTAVAIMQLHEKGLIDLDTPIDTYLGGQLPEDKRQITVRQLLAHTSGIPQYADEDEIENTTHYASLQDAMKVFIERPLLFEPGTQYYYTTYGYVVLGRIIEAVTSLTYEAYMKSHVFDVAGMASTRIEYLNQDYPNKACLYHNSGRRAKEGKQNDLSNRVPGGGYISTLADLIRFGNALLDNRLLSKESLDEMLHTQPVEYDGNKYGLGWFFYGPPPHDNLVIGHSGGQTGCTSQLMIIPKSKTVIVVLSNTSGNYPDIATFAVNLTAYSESKD